MIFFWIILHFSLFFNIYLSFTFVKYWYIKCCGRGTVLKSDFLKKYRNNILSNSKKNVTLQTNSDK